MKSILMSIQPKWVEKIISGEKTIEVRKTAPKEMPFKVYIYCTEGGQILREAFYPNGKPDKKYFYLADRNRNHEKNLNGKVIGEFVCDKVEQLQYQTTIPCIKINENDEIEISGNTAVEPFYNGKVKTIKESCLTQEQLLAYGQGKTLYALHITDLKIYDKPKELSDFRKPDTSCGFYIKDLERCDSGYNCERCVYNDLTITRPPQSWQYVEEVEE